MNAGRALVLAILAALVVWSIAVAPLAAASPDPSMPAAGGDPRSEGEGPGLVGQPLLAIGGVIGLGLLSAAAALAYIRLTDRPESGRRDH